MTDFNCELESCATCEHPNICNSLVLCRGEGCPIAEACVRASPSWDMGRFFAGVPFKDGKCEYFIERQ
jgi:hypothetical protein